MKKYITADTHFGHKNILKYCNRPFTTIEEMDDTIIDNWNSIVTPQDIVYHVGDFAFGDIITIGKYIKKLNGNIIFIEGNHDRQLAQYLKRTGQKLHKNLIVKAYDEIFYLAHYAHRVWYNSHYGTIHCFGHSHGQLEDYRLSTDVGMDANGFKLVDIEKTLDIMIPRRNKLIAQGVIFKNDKKK